jgi:hypothetical protein
MDHRDATAFTAILAAYKRLWINFRVQDAIRRNPHVNRETVLDWAEGVATEGLAPVFHALESGQDVLAATQELLQGDMLPADLQE